MTNRKRMTAAANAVTRIQVGHRARGDDSVASQSQRSGSFGSISSGPSGPTGVGTGKAYAPG